MLQYRCRVTGIKMCKSRQNGDLHFLFSATRRLPHKKNKNLCDKEEIYHEKIFIYNILTYDPDVMQCHRVCRSSQG